MSDEETQKKRGYRLEYASSGRAKCKGPKPCQGCPIVKGELRFGSLVDFQGNKSFAWRHWGCVTAALLKNVKTIHETSDDVDGYEELSAEDQKKIDKAWEDGAVADEDIPDTARKPEGEKKKTAAKRTKDDGEAADAPPKRKRAPAKKDKAEDAGSDAEKPARKKRIVKKKDDSDGEVEEVKEKPAPRKRKAPVKKKAVEEDNDSAEEITIPADLSGSDDEKETKKPTKKAPAKKKEAEPKKRAAAVKKPSSSRKKKVVVEDDEDDD